MNDWAHFLSDPRVFAVGRLPAVSDHKTYQTLAQVRAGRSGFSMPLDGTWKFSYAETPQQAVQGFEQPGFDDSAMQDIQVPGHIQMQGYGTPHYVNTQYPWDGHERLTPPQIPKRYNPTGSYIRDFTLPESWGLRENMGGNPRVVAVFHGVESAFMLWLNGRFLGYSEDSFTPARFDLTPALQAGVNRLAVRVFRFCSGSWLEDQDFWRFSGILRGVELRYEPCAHVADIFARGLPDGAFENGTLTAELTLSLPDAPVRLRAELFDREGRAADTFETRAEKKMTLSRRVARPLLWSAEAPNLYCLRLSLLDARGETLEIAQTAVGFRRVEIVNGVLLLNGRRLLFHGVNRHEFSCDTGRAISEKDMRFDIETLKRHNVNAVRTSHYPNQSLWYELCDEYGIYLIDETNLETHGTWNRNGRIDRENALPGDREEWLGAVLDRAKSMLERDKNHPSVLLWSCGNESFGGRDLFELSQFFRRRDPGRPVHYEGVFNDRRYNATSDVESQMYTPAAQVAEYLAAHPEKPFILCEYSHAMGNSCGGLAQYLKLEDRFERYQGGFIWDYIDQALRVTARNGKTRLAYGGDFGDQPTDRNFCTNGLVFADRTLSPKLQEVKYLYQPVRITPDETGVTLENRSLFDDLSGYNLCWRMLEDGKETAHGTLNAIKVPAGEKARFPLALKKAFGHAERVLICELCLKDDANWAQKGYPQMRGYAVLSSPEKSRAKEISGRASVSVCDSNAGVSGPDFEALFSFAEGGLTGYGRPNCPSLVLRAPTVSLFRAPGDNDLGNGLARRQALWRAFSLCSIARFVSAREENGGLCVRCRYEMPSLAQVQVEVVYHALPDGSILVKETFPGAPGMAELASFGLSLRVDGALEQVRYYGLGPEENYIDRREGAWLSVHQTTARGNLTPYILPQFCANRGGVRWLEATDAAGRGLRIEMVDAPLEISVLPVSQEELAAAYHQDELPDTGCVHIDIASERMGIAGDNSWGAPVLPQYCLPSNRPYALSFRMQLIGLGGAQLGGGAGGAFSSV